MQTILIKAFAQYRKYLCIYFFSLILSLSLKYSIFYKRLFLKILILIHVTVYLVRVAYTLVGRANHSATISILV